MCKKIYTFDKNKILNLHPVEISTYSIVEYFPETFHIKMN